MSMLDRPISEFDGPIDSVRVPVVPPKGECRPFQEVLIELASRLKFPAFVNADGSRKFRDYPDFIVNYETEPGSGIGFLVRLARQGRRQVHARRAQSAAVGDVREEQLRLSTTSCRRRTSTCATGTRATWSGRSACACAAITDPIVIQIYSEVLQKFRLAAQGKGARAAAARASARAHRDATSIRCRSTTRRSRRRRPTSRAIRSPRSRSGRWRCTTRGIRRTRGCARSTRTTTCSSIRGVARGRGHRRRRLDVGRIAVGQGALHVRATREAVEPGTVWTWNAIGKARGRVAPRAGRERIAARLPAQSPDLRRAAGAPTAARISNSDPITGQAGWYDVRVRIYKAEAGRAARDVAAVRADAARCRARSRRVRAGRRSSPARTKEDAAMTQLALVIDLNVCVGCHACVTSCKEWNTSGSAGPLADEQPVRQGSDRHVLQPRADVRGRRVSRTRRPCISRSRACTARIRRACRCARPARATSAPRTASCSSTTTSASAASTARGRVPYGVRELDENQQGDDQVHAVRRPHLRRGAAGGRPQARVRAGVPDQRAPLRRHPRSRVGRVEGDPRERRLCADAGVGHAARPTTTCRGARPSCASTPTSSSAPTIRSRSTACCRSRAKSDPSLDDVTSW